jgi:hypothetical protein
LEPGPERVIVEEHAAEELGDFAAFQKEGETVTAGRANCSASRISSRLEEMYALSRMSVGFCKPRPPRDVGRHA